jgi:hypothetical protein
MKIIQAYNPRTKQWIKIDRTKGQILAVKKTEGKFKGVPVFKKRK